MKKMILGLSLLISSLSFAEGWLQDIKSTIDSIQIRSPLANSKLETKVTMVAKEFMSQIGNSQRLDEAKNKIRLAHELKRVASEEVITSLLKEEESENNSTEMGLAQMKLLLLRASAQGMVLLSRGPRVVEVTDGSVQDKETAGLCRGRACEIRYYKVRPYLTSSVTLGLACREVPEKEPRNTTCQVTQVKVHEPYVVLEQSKKNH